LLKGLAYLKTQSSYTAFYELLMSEPPLVGAVNTVNDVFFVLHDSLELCKQFFPEILLLTKYEEYKDAVYTLMSELVSKKLITPASFESEKNNILLDANLALKRYNPASTSNTYDQGSFDYLDKASKEIAESIKGSLEGLSNNNFYKNSDYLRTMEAFNRPALVNYARVLAPFYKTDEKVKQFFDKLSRIKSQNILMPLTITLLKQNVILSDTLIRHYSGNKYTRAYFYSELDKEKLAPRFDKKFLSQESLIESVLLGQKQLSSYYSYDKDKSRKDSIFLVKKVDAVNKYQKGKMFIYRHSKSKNEQEQWSAVFIKDTKELINPKIEIVQSAYYIDSQKSEEENINKLLDYFYLTYRARAQPNSNSYD
jgi:hypothetical protein